MKTHSDNLQIEFKMKNDASADCPSSPEINTVEYNLIYVFRVGGVPKLKGMHKVGQTTLKTALPPEQLPPNCDPLNAAAKRRIDEYTKTMTLNDDYELEYTVLAIRERGGKSEMFPDKEVHALLRKNGVNILSHKISGRLSEWCETSLNRIKKAIEAIKTGNLNINAEEDRDPIMLRKEQKEAVEKTCKRFQKHKRMLWYAKPRFGKTVCALNVVKKMGYQRTLVLTHRPVVEAGWREDFFKIFTADDGYAFGSRSRDTFSLGELRQQGKKYVYFASLQDLRGSSWVNEDGGYEKNEDVFRTSWDCVVIDEAHEGTLTDRGKSVIHALLKDEKQSETRVLHLSGTPFNLLDDFREEETFTWDYIAEQSAKERWYLEHFCDPNPYEVLPKLNILTYDLNKEISGFEDADEKAFNFREFFRVWTGKPESDGRPLPDGVQAGTFVYESRVRRFLELLCKPSATSHYPFSSPEYRENFRHTFWILPGVAAVKALKALMQKMEGSVFSSDMFKIRDIAGEGDEDNEGRSALESVRNAISEKPEETYSITLSCGRLTTGVTVPEWTAVLMLDGAYTTSAASYMQTIFRVQSAGCIGGKMKTECYAFDFAPDRALRMVAEACRCNIKAGQSTETEREYLARFLNFCPVISGEGGHMVKYDVDRMMQALKNSYVEYVVNKGFDDDRIYNRELESLDENGLRELNELCDILGETKQAQRPEHIRVAANGFTRMERMGGDEGRQPDAPPAPVTGECNKRQEETNLKNKQRAISILRGISIRIPLLIYGVDIHTDQEITVDTLPDLVDDESWAEFMPLGITKSIYHRFSKYYDKDIFSCSVNRIRAMARQADCQQTIEGRIDLLRRIFDCFRDPDKENVLTPWSTVNRHLASCLGGYAFYDVSQKTSLSTPSLLLPPSGEVVFRPDARILELNAKTGLYSLYAAYSMMRARAKELTLGVRDAEAERSCWAETLRENIFIICRTALARRIVQRTLAGSGNTPVNILLCPDMTRTIKQSSQNIIRLAENPASYSTGLPAGKMSFTAIIGNPPYQVNDGGNAAGDASTPIYDDFVRLATSMQPDYISLMIPSRWMVGGKKKLSTFRQEMMEDKHFLLFDDYEDASSFFPYQHIDGGICYFLWARRHNGTTAYRHYPLSGNPIESDRFLKLFNQEEDHFELDVILRNSHPLRLSLLRKAALHTVSSAEKSGTEMVEGGSVRTKFSSIVSSTNPYGIRKDLFNKKEKYEALGGSETAFKDSVKIWGVEGYKGAAKRKNCYIRRSAVGEKFRTAIGKYKLFFTTSYSTGQINHPAIIEAGPKDVCTETFLQIGPFSTARERDNCLSYMRTRFFKFMLFLRKGSMQVSQNTFSFIPLLSFDRRWDDASVARELGLTPGEVDYINSFF